jgi:hypothetical protein
MRLSEFAKNNGLNEGQLIKYFDYLKWNYTSFSKKLSDSEINDLREIHLHKHDLILNSSHIQLLKNKIVHETDIVPQEFNITHKYATRISELFESSNSEQDRIKKIFENKTELDDYGVIAILEGLKNREAKNICKKYYNGSIDSELMNEAYSLAKDTIERYGEDVIFDLIKLPKLPFKVVKFREIFLELDKKKSHVLDPSIRLIIDKTSIQVKFFQENREGSKVLFKNVIEVTNRETRDVLFQLTRDGFCLPKTSNSSVIPVIQMFLSYSIDLKKQILHYGLVTGECSICGRPLSDPESIKIGMGPICRQDFF